MIGGDEKEIIALRPIFFGSALISDPTGFRSSARRESSRLRTFKPNPLHLQTSFKGRGKNESNQGDRAWGPLKAIIRPG